ncbi:MAG: prepilin-type N-terminal cleavage/methylation domain-containing protein [Planctomycetes bacterium]|nr:prepilin-type N-terminal cleavage/methylation domain-containing protein [Planctomycetota bacterium]
MTRNVLHKPMRRIGFTLLEIMVAIGIIALLAGITIGLSNSIMRKAEQEQTHDTLRLLKIALKEWEISVSNPLTFQDFSFIGNCPECYFDVNNDGVLGSPVFGLAGVSNDDMQVAMVNRSTQVIATLRQVQSADNILLEITADNFENGIPLDAWGTPIGIIFPGRYFAEAGGLLFFAEDESGDLTIRDQAEDGLGSCINKRPVFVSAGPDRIWGYRFQAAGGPGSDDNAKEMWNASLDNLYSYTPFVVEEAQ